MRRFSHFACVDWSGAKTERPGGIAVATIGPEGPPALLSPDPRWSRADVLTWLQHAAEDKRDLLIGLDLSMALPFLDEGAYFPEWQQSPENAKSLWSTVDAMCSDDPHLNATSLLAHAQASRHFRHGRGHVGDLFAGGIGRLREVERYQRVTGQANSASCFNLVGAAQVGKSSLTGMRMLHQLGGAIPVWPFDPVPDRGPVLIEIYTTVAALAAGLPKGRSKVRDRAGLKQALTRLNTPTPARLARYDDHSTDALITAAWMKQAAANPGLWNPPAMTEEIAQKEGWTFGVV
ncbi:MAG: hypothetical protein GW808_03610 [Sphingomonadales bacterium]|nr:hypothetical protein [Sphingomonadales bacterium]NCO49163.1 hypothetical protein [Sphingomonadales bacterium]NCP01660.1 hypothetical protein [Sphingomonadales bacterium]NCP27983.1 hypothetical protein [Sphingomonadales bacterium]NCP42619.1 hypothetical protein [Sphingomonadales bacterium]